MTAKLLEVRGLEVAIGAGADALRVVSGVDLDVARGEAVSLVGESGCGKSMTAFALLGLFPTPAARVAEGRIVFEGVDLVALPERERRRLRGARIAMIFQDPSTYLDPLMPVGRQIAEPLHAHGFRGDIRGRVVELLQLMELPDPERLADRYPHELSGGQRQRVLIASALALEPALLIADEPTTALDVTVQAGILDLLMRLKERLGLSLLLITHDLGVVAETCDRAYVMYAGRIVETRSVEALFTGARHPYSQGLLRSTLGVEGPRADLFAIPGRVPNMRALPGGCRFHPRCPLAKEVPCRTAEPDLLASPDGAAACWRSDFAAEAGAWP